MVAKVILNRTAYATDVFYDYNIPEYLDVKVGMRVAVPFGKGNKTEEGYVVAINTTSEFQQLKDIFDIIDDFVYFDSSSVDLAEFMHHRYFCRYSEAMKCMLPPRVNAKFKNIYSVNLPLTYEQEEIIGHSVTFERIVDALKEHKTLDFEKLSEQIKGKNIRLALSELVTFGIINEKFVANEVIKDSETTVVYVERDKEEIYSYAANICKKAPKQAAVLETVCDNDGIYLSELLQMCNTTHATINLLVKKGFLRLDKEVVRGNIFECDEYEHNKIVSLTEQQSRIINEISADISEGECSTYLLHGVTGSGKTEVYLNLVDQCVREGKKAIFLVPEISLTPQMIRQVVHRFGENVAVLHSSLTLRERYDQWKKIRCGEVDVVVGARSAIFAPFKDIGLIIIDEEHESSYKSELSPKYSTVEIARFRAKQCNSVLVLASATPSVENYYLAKSGKIKLLELPQRINKSPLPEIEIVDMRSELKGGNTDILSQKLKDSIEFNLENGFKTILFLNRRGYSGFIQCRSCGYVVECPNCNISMTYHRNNSSLVCHYCDYKTPLLNVCPKCGSNHIKFSGDGTQKVEDELSLLFPQAKILRMDADTTSSRNAHEKILDEFSEDESDILIGTQMITKGLDFEKVTLVGVLSADISLNINDFRSDEKTFDLITQVCGRAGRGKYSGKAIIQTYDPDNETINFCKSQDYKMFYEREIAVRKNLTYPPFCEMINFIFTSEDEMSAYNCAKRFHLNLKQKLEEFDCLNYVIAYNVMQAPIPKINGNYRYRFILKLSYNKKVYNAIHECASEYRKGENSANLIIEANPYSLY